MHDSKGQKANKVKQSTTLQKTVKRKKWYIVSLSLELGTFVYESYGSNVLITT